MWMKILTAAALAVALGLAPAIAQDDPSAEQQPPAAAESEGQQQLPTETESYQPEAQSSEMNDLTGWPVYGADGEELGTVTHVKLGADGNVEAIHTDIGGFLGLGGKTVEISADQFSQGDNRIDLSMSAEEASDLPEVAEQ